MRRGLIIFLIINLLIIVFLIRSVFTLLTLLVEDASADAIHRSEIPAPNSPLIDNRPQVIPKIIHQTYINESIPEHWREAQQSCVDLHEDYEYKVCFTQLHTWLEWNCPIALVGQWTAAVALWTN
jgi:mannosyltransferase OCH1-like enzyme